MKIFKISLLFCYFSIGLFSALCAERVCLPNESIDRQKNRYVSQGLLAAMMKEKIIFSWPVKVCDCWISSLYGKRGAGFHHGVDLAAHKGTNVFAAADGYVEVIEKSNDPHGYGNMILMSHYNSTYKTRYAHLDSIESFVDHPIKKGKKVFVKRGQKIGTVGATGHVIRKKKNDPSHLHFEIYKGNERIDPLKYLFASDIMLLKNKKMRKRRVW